MLEAVEAIALPEPSGLSQESPASPRSALSGDPDGKIAVVSANRDSLTDDEWRTCYDEFISELARTAVVGWARTWEAIIQEGTRADADRAWPPDRQQTDDEPQAFPDQQLATAGHGEAGRGPQTSSPRSGTCLRQA
jgi:hypothetical protein